MGKRTKETWNFRKPVSWLAALFLLSLSGTARVYADELIKTVSITVESRIEASEGAGEVRAYANNSRYQAVHCEFVSPKNEWKAGETPKIKIELAAEEGYYFGALSSGKVTLKGAEYLASRKGTDNNSVVITAKLKPVNGTLDAPDEALWDKASLGRAKWTKVGNAPAYEVMLFCNDNMIYRIKKLTATSCDLYPHMTSAGEYYVKVRAVAQTEADSKFLKSSDWTESEYLEITKRDAQAAKDRVDYAGKRPASDVPHAESEGWKQDSNGWWYRDANGSYPIGSWRFINGKWYLFDMNGYMLTGWQKKNGHQYYLTSNGDLVVGWFQYNRTWYYMDEQVGMKTDGWMKQGEEWYYLNPDGSMVTGWLKYRDKWYYLDPRSGRMVKNCKVESYTINQDGEWVP